MFKAASQALYNAALTFGVVFFVRNRPTLVMIWSKLAQIGRMWPKTPLLADFGPMLGSRGNCSTTCRQLRSSPGSQRIFVRGEWRATFPQLSGNLFYSLCRNRPLRGAPSTLYHFVSCPAGGARLGEFSAGRQQRVRAAARMWVTTLLTHQAGENRRSGRNVVGRGEGPTEAGAGPRRRLPFRVPPP